MDDTNAQAQQSQTPTTNKLSFEFRGDGFEYFKIWIVNLLLSIVTLGIYSAWAKVRSNRYFYSNLYLGDSNFRYLAEPLTILKGRIVAVIVFAIYGYLAQTNLTAAVILGGILFLLIPYFINMGLAFSNRMSSYKNIQFRFKGSYGQAFIVFYLWPIIGVLSAGILYPYALIKTNQYVVNNSSYGTTHFNFDATYKDYGIILVTILGVGVIVSAISFGLSSLIPTLSFIPAITMPIMYLGLFLYFSSASTNLFYKSITLSEHGFEANLSIIELGKVILTNIALILVTFGLYAPAAKVRMTKYMASCITMNAVGELDGFTADEQEKVSAMGEEFGEIFDFGA